MTYGAKHTTNVPMNVLIFLVALSLLRFCSSRHFRRTLPKDTGTIMAWRHHHRHAGTMKGSIQEKLGVNVKKPRCCRLNDDSI